MVQVKIRTLKLRATNLWFVAQWELSYDAATVYPVWSRTIDALTHKLAVDNGLPTEKRPKAYFGIPELRLLFPRLSKLTSSVDWWKQHYIFCATMAITGARPGSLAVSSKDRSIAEADLQCVH